MSHPAEVLLDKMAVEFAMHMLEQEPGVGRFSAETQSAMVELTRRAFRRHRLEIITILRDSIKEETGR